MQTATFDAASGNTEGGVTNLMIKSGTNVLQGHGLLSPRRRRASSPTTSSPTRTTSRCRDFDYNRYGGMAGGPMVLPGYNGRGKTFFMYGFEGIHEVAPAQQRHADGPDREDAQRRFLGAARARAAVSDLQPVHAAGDRRRPLPAGSVPGQHHSAAADQPGRAGRARVHRQAADAGQRRRHQQLPEPVAARGHQVREQHDPRRPQHHRQAAHVRPRELVRSQQQLQQLLRQPLDRRVVQVRLAAGRARPRLRDDAEHGAELPLRLQLVRARHGLEPGKPRLRSRRRSASPRRTTRRFPTASAGSRGSTSPAIRAPASAARSGRTRRIRSSPR